MHPVVPFLRPRGFYGGRYRCRVRRLTQPGGVCESHIGRSERNRRREIDVPVSDRSELLQCFDALGQIRTTSNGTFVPRNAPG